ncbi:MAG: TRAP transporter large permease subunit [Chloroflexota bacterium]
MRFSKITRPLNTVSEKTSRAANALGLFIIVAMMLLTFINVFLRYAFNEPIKGAYEITELMMAALVFLGLGYTALQKGHVSIEWVVSRLSARAGTALGKVTQVLSIIFLALIAWQGIAQAQAVQERHTVAGLTNIPVFPFLYVLAFGAAVMCLVLLADLLNYLNEPESRRWEPWLWLVSAVLLGTAPWWLHRLPQGLSPLAAGGIGVVFLFIALFSGIPIGIGMGLVGFLGSIYLIGTNPTLGILKAVPYRTAASYTLSVVPLFVLMGALASTGGLSRDIYYAAYRWLGRLRGGLAMSTVAACAGFAAICGSSPATAVAMGTVSLPEMERYKYDPSLATGSVAAGGTLGILIPPSLGFILYGLLAEESIGKLFLAGILPGILLAFLFIVAIYLMTLRNPKLGPAAPGTTFREKMAAFKGVWAITLLFVVVMGGFYFGVFSPTEAGGVGAFGALVITLSTRRLSWSKFVGAVVDTGKITSMVFLILIGAMIFGYFLAYTRLPFELAGFVTGLNLPPLAILTAVLLVYLALGCIMDSLSLIILTTPIFLPLILALGFDPIWFGVIFVIILEAGLITPPVGMNVYIIKGVAKDVPMETIFRGILPFLAAMIFCIVILTAFPQIALFLPNLMK